MMIRKSFLLVTALSLTEKVSCYDNGIGRTPPMGWNSWNRFGCSISEKLVRQTADAIVDLELDRLGYRYVNLDDCWQVSRNKTGHIQEDAVNFPSGMRSLSDYVHAKGLRFGLYSDAGVATCQGRPGSLYHERQDVASYRAFDIDYLKYDNCHPTLMPVQERYRRMHEALNQSGGRAIYFSMCEWGREDPARWAPAIANSWRTTDDIGPTWSSMLDNLDRNDLSWWAAGPGNWNDPDMLQVGNGDLTATESRSHFTLWCLIKSPLLLGNDLRNMSADTLEIITNTEVIAWNQDGLGKQGKRVARTILPDSSEDEETAFTEMTAFPIFITAAAGTVLFCCVSACFCVGSGVKGAYDDLAFLSMHGGGGGGGGGDVALSAIGSRRENGENDGENDVVGSNGGENDSPSEDEDEGGQDQVSALLSRDGNNNGSDSGAGGRLIRFRFTRPHQQQNKDEDDQQHSHRRRRRRPRHMRRMYWTCAVCYVVTVATIAASVAATLYLYPKMKNRINAGVSAVEVWAGPLEKENIAVVLFNPSPRTANITAQWIDVGILRSGTAMVVRDVWLHRDLGTFREQFTATVESHGVVALQLSPAVVSNLAD